MALSKRLRKTRPLLKLLLKASPKRRKTIIQAGGGDVLYSLCECCKNLVDGRVKISPQQKKRLIKYKTSIRKMADRKVPLKVKQRIVSQSGGFIGPLLSILAPAIGGLISSIGG